MAFTSITPLSPYTFVGATTGARGAGGLIPTPQAGDQGKLLQGDGTWSSSFYLRSGVQEDNFYDCGISGAHVFRGAANEHFRIDGSGAAIFSNAISETSQNSFTTTLGAGVNIDLAAGTVLLGSGDATITGFNFTNVPQATNRSTTASVFLSNTGSFSYGRTCTVNGTNVAGGIRWSAGVTPTASTGVDILTFAIVRDNSSNVMVFGFSTTNLI